MTIYCILFITIFLIKMISTRSIYSGNIEFARKNKNDETIALFVVCFLKEDIGPNSRVLKPAIVFHRRGGDIDVHPSDIAVFVVDGVDRFDTFEDIFYWVQQGMLTGFDRQALVPHILKRNDLCADFVLRQLFTGNMRILQVIRTVDAAVDTVVGEIQRCEHHDAIAVEGLLDLVCKAVHLLHFFGNVAGEQHRRLTV